MKFLGGCINRITASCFEQRRLNRLLRGQNESRYKYRERCFESVKIDSTRSERQVNRLAEVKKVYLPDVVGKGYGKFWNWKGRYRVVKGSRASKKSTTTALNIICRMIEYPLANTLVVRKTASTLKDSCFAQFS